MAEIPVRFHIELGSTLNALQPTSGQRAKKSPCPLTRGQRQGRGALRMVEVEVELTDGELNLP